MEKQEMETGNGNRVNTVACMSSIGPFAWYKVHFRCWLSWKVAVESYIVESCRGKLWKVIVESCGKLWKVVVGF